MPLHTDEDFQEELEYLYQRLSAVNNLIRSLEQYDKLRPKPAEVAKEKSA